MRKINITIFIFFLSLTLRGQLTISILGDSYSAFAGHVDPETNAIWYADSMRYDNDVRRANEMWWWLLADELKLSIQKNNSYSGSTICNTGYYHRDYSDRSFIARMKDIGSPDVLIIFGGTNDCWVKAPLGEYLYQDWTTEELLKFRPALCYMLDYLKKHHPKMQILFVCNTDLTQAYTSSMKTVCQHYGVDYLELTNINKQSGHPSILGMRQIATQIENRLKLSTFTRIIHETHKSKITQLMQKLFGFRKR
jgi:lysophospholipase L1-like esterase